MRNFGVFLAAMVIACALAPSALACSPLKDATYDDYRHPSVTVFAGSILAIELVPYGENGSCINIRYHVDELIHGATDELLSIAECANDVPIAVMSQHKANMEKSFGMKLGAYVQVATTLEGVQGHTPRLLNPHCWGWQHQRIGRYAATARQQIVERSRISFED